MSIKKLIKIAENEIGYLAGCAWHLAVKALLNSYITSLVQLVNLYA